MKTTVRVPEELWRRVKILAIHEKLTVQEVIERALKLYLKSSRKKKEGGAR